MDARIVDHWRISKVPENGGLKAKTKSPETFRVYAHNTTFLGLALSRHVAIGVTPRPCVAAKIVTAVCALTVAE